MINEQSIKINTDDYIKIKTRAKKDKRTIKGTLSIMIDIALKIMGKSK